MAVVGRTSSVLQTVRSKNLIQLLTNARGDADGPRFRYRMGCRRPVARRRLAPPCHCPSLSDCWSHSRLKFALTVRLDKSRTVTNRGGDCPPAYASCELVENRLSVVGTQPRYQSPNRTSLPRRQTFWIAKTTTTTCFICSCVDAASFVVLT